MRKRLKRGLGVLLAAVFVMSLAACSGSGKPDGSNVPTSAGSTSAAANQPYAGQMIRFVAANHMWTDVIKEKISDFESETGIKVSLESYAEDQLNQKLSIEFTSGNSNIDVFMTRPIQEKLLFYKNGWYEVLDGYVADTGKTPADWSYDDFMPGLVQQDVVDGKLIGIPLTNEFQMLFYRTDLFEKAGLKPPQTFEELEEAAKILHDPTNEVYGIVARGNMGAAVPVWGCFMYGYGGDWLKDGKCIVNNEAGLESLKLYGRLLKNYGPPGVMNMGWPQCVAIFAAGKAAMYVEGNAQMAQFADSEKSTIADKFGVAVFPAGPVTHKTYQTSSWGLAISSASQYKDAGWKFITWSTNKENMKMAQLGNIGMSRSSIWEDADVKASLRPGFADVVLKTAEIGIPYYAPPMMAVSEARDILGVPVVKSIESGGTGNLQAELDAAAAKVNELLDAEK